MKHSVLNVRFKTERLIRAAAGAVSPLRQKTASARVALQWWMKDMVTLLLGRFRAVHS
jgi:hypothetical protein